MKLLAAIAISLALCASAVAQAGPRAVVTLSNGTVRTDRATNLTITNGLLLSTLTNSAVRVVTIGTNGEVGASSGVPSGAAASNSILTADGAGSSAFVASRLQAARLTTNVVRTNTDQSSTNAVADFTFSVTANTVYALRYSFYITCTNTTSSGAWAALLSSAGTNGWAPQQVGRVGRPNTTWNDTQVSALSAGQGIALLHSSTGYGGDATNQAFNGFGVFATGPSNSTLTVRFAQNFGPTNSVTLHSNSVITIERMTP